MSLKLTAVVESFKDAGSIAWVDNEKFKGMITQAPTPEEAFCELITSLKVKIAFDYGIHVASITEKETEDGRELTFKKKDNKPVADKVEREINLIFS